MSYIVASATEPDYKFDTYEEAWEWSQFMRREGIITAIVTSDDPWVLERVEDWHDHAARGERKVCG